MTFEIVPKRRGRKLGVKVKVHKVYSVYTMLSDLKHGESVIIPVPPHLSRARFQANLKAIQSKSKGALILRTAQVFFFSGTPVKDDRLLEAIRVTVLRFTVPK